MEGGLPGKGEEGRRPAGVHPVSPLSDGDSHKLREASSLQQDINLLLLARRPSLNNFGRSTLFSSASHAPSSFLPQWAQGSLIIYNDKALESTRMYNYIIATHQNDWGLTFTAEPFNKFCRGRKQEYYNENWNFTQFQVGTKKWGSQPETKRDSKWLGRPHIPVK